MTVNHHPLTAVWQLLPVLLVHYLTMFLDWSGATDMYTISQTCMWYYVHGTVTFICSLYSVTVCVFTLISLTVFMYVTYLDALVPLRERGDGL